MSLIQLKGLLLHIRNILVSARFGEGACKGRRTSEFGKDVFSYQLNKQSVSKQDNSMIYPGKEP